MHRFWHSEEQFSKIQDVLELLTHILDDYLWGWSEYRIHTYLFVLSTLGFMVVDTCSNNLINLKKTIERKEN